MRSKAGMKFDCVLEETLDFIDIDYTHLNKTVRYEERQHGEWLSHYEYCKKHDFIPSGLIAFWWCNKCEQGVEIPTNFCPNCGADMRKSGEEE